MAYRFLEPKIETDQPGGPRPNLAQPDVYTTVALAPDTCRQMARAVLQAHGAGQSWESPTRYAPGHSSPWDINGRFRSSRNLKTDLPGLDSAFDALDRHALQAFPLLGLDVRHSVPRRISDQCIFYGAGDHLGDHADDSDSFQDDHGRTVWTVIKPQRHLVGVLWLTTQTADGAGEMEFAGGELRFNSLVDEATGQPMAVPPTAGKLVVFPATAWFRHEVLPVRAGTRITVTRWWEVVPREASAGTG
ncbi:2OG-Fe(II) oxygenase [Ramlibacter humi]|uniref:2OG-Fe(II) oxygenase n=1 Tax=Ramlibacter humi TaxID=2530451 RepID=A0A4Z0BGM3_9BURK|nr:2OG-Fe(II) oxygenase [Ramlibacter humi]TFY97058.1 2OG-Fe(II) oxygenase [Ramlibacter humi]